MKLALLIATGVAALMVMALWDQPPAAKAKTVAPFECRAPTAEGEIAVVTFTVHAGEIVAACHYASTRQSKPKKGG